MDPLSSVICLSFFFLFFCFLLTYLGETGDKLVGKSVFAGISDHTTFYLITCILPYRPYETEFDILVDTGIKEDVVLLNKPDLSSPPLRVDVGEFRPGNGYLSIPEIENLERRETS